MKKLISSMIKLANKLDKLGLFDEADMLDNIIVEIVPQRTRWRGKGLGPGKGIGRELGICPLEDHKNYLLGGEGDELDEEDVDPKQLEMGIDVEMEHTDNPEIAKDISFDHLSEFGDYYTRLKEMEEEAEEEKK